MADKYAGMSVAEIREAQAAASVVKAPEVTSVLTDGLEALYAQLQTILGVDALPAAALALRDQYAALLFNLARDVTLGVVTPEAAKYELKQAKNGLIQAIGSIGLDLAGRRQAALTAALETALSVLLKVGLGLLK